MRKATATVMTLASTAAIGAAWLVGLSPVRPPGAGLRPVAGDTRLLGTNTGEQLAGRSSSRAKSGSMRSTPSRAASTVTPTAAPRSGHVDGPPVDTQYGTVQVRVGYTGRRITRVTALHLTDSSGTSVSISAGAEPILRREALSAQSAQIDVVSGATYTSEAYKQSLQAAIDAAHLG